MAKIEVFFVNGNRAKFDRDKVLFHSADGQFALDFTGVGDDMACLALVNNGMALVNWGAVSFVRAAEDKEDE